MVTHPLPMPAPVLPKRDRGPVLVSPKVTAPGGDVFIAAMLETPFSHLERRNPLEWLASLVVHILFISALIIAPLYFTDTLDLRGFTQTFLVGPPPPAAPPPAAAIVQKIVRNPAARLMQAGRLTTPVMIPKQIAMVKEEALPPDVGLGVVGGVPGGIPGGQVGGVLGGIIGGTGKSVVVPPPPAAVKRIVRVGGQVKEPRLTYKPELPYPPIARAARVEGVVTIEAVVDETGEVVKAHVVSGPGLLIPAALQAVAHWKYEPTLLNGEPVSIEMTIYVKYHIQ